MSRTAPVVALLVGAFALAVLAGCGSGQEDLESAVPTAGQGAPDGTTALRVSCKPNRPCDDGNACTSNDTCIAGACRGTAYSCDDNNVCTADYCDGAGGCTHVAISGACNDGDPCTYNDTCIAGACTGTPHSCDDNNVCTADYCDGAGGCTHVAISGACNDSNPCTYNDTCIGGECRGTPYSCDDANVCTADSCDGAGGCTHVPIASCATIPAAPTLTSATPIERYVWIRWADNSTNEDGFRLERSRDAGATWELATLLLPNAMSRQDCDVGLDQEVCYRVVAFNALGNSPPSNVICTAIPRAPTDLRAAVVDSAIEVTWTDNSSVEDGYVVWRSDGIEARTVVAQLPPSSIGYRDVDVTADVTYIYWVRANRDDGGSEETGIASAVLVTVPPAAPPWVRAMPCGSTVIGIAWGDQARNEEGFRIERSADGGATWVTFGTSGPDVFSIPPAPSPAGSCDFVDSGRTTEEQVCYRVFAYNSKGDSLPSETACTAPPAAPSDLTATATADGVELRWTDNSAVEDGYSVVVWTDCPEQPDAWIGWLPANSTSYLDTWGGRQWCLSPFPPPTYQVRATKNDGWSDFSDPVVSP